ncbi:uncharacterized protein DDB_G0287625 [Camellia sinensis]|uniref:uncharacterized protein DDB_G0287625 n=1 Tax=Camellia sinensis TaxID=4442 RepID=UPI001035E9BA|nr:uncharacterized protein DDB_G0287625 [Camellia sinensis]
MGSSRSSSKRKSSKRKSSKLSSEARRKKRSRRTKSRKLRHRDDSSSYSNDDSRSSVPISSSSSEDEYSRARSRTRSEVKGSRKRTRRSSSSRGSSEDSRHVKKKKDSKRSSKSETKKKTRRKKRRREPSVSSISSDSRSCSPCRGAGSSSGESDFERLKRGSREKSKDKRALGKAKSGTKSNKNRSRTPSCGRYSDSGGYGSKDVMPVENSSRRLRSVITVAKSQEEEVEEKEWDNDGHKEEIVYDRDDCPSCRSNDSNDGGSKRELAHHSHVDLERWVEDAKGEEALVSDVKMTDLTKSGEEGGRQDCQSNSRSDGAGADNSLKEKNREVFPTSSSSKSDDLESILRLKALENLKKFRGGLQTNTKPPADEKSEGCSDVKQLCTANVEFVQNRSPKEDVSRAVDATRVLDQNPTPTSYGKLLEGKGGGSVTESASARLSVVCPPNQVALSSKEVDLSPAGAVTSKSEMSKSALRKESSGTIVKQTDKTNMFVTEGNVNKSSAETSKSAGQTSNNNDVGVNNVTESSTSEPSSLKPTLEEHSSKEQLGQDKDGSQFEKKTMSVMRGGEMVQVSYKVYIPKKAPALARRHLRR